MTKQKMSLYEMKVYMARFLKDAYDLDLDIPVEINGRLSRTLGRFHFIGDEGSRVPVKFDFAKKLLEHGSLKDIKGVLRHEAIHYAMYIMDRPFRDGEDAFERQLELYDAPATNVLKIKSKQLLVTHACGCGNEWVYRRGMKSGYVCGSCNNPIVEVKREYVYDY